MRWTSALAIYFLIWFFCLFLVLPFHARTADETGGVKVAGQADSAPAHFPVARVAMQVTLLAALGFALFYANYVTGFISAADLDLFGRPSR